MRPPFRNGACTSGPPGNQEGEKDLKIYRQIIRGATCYGIGAAWNAGPDTLILEPGIHPGGEFADAFDPGSAWNGPLRTGEARGFRAGLEKRNALRDGAFHLPALIPLLSSMILENGIGIRLVQTVTSVIPENGVLRIRCAAPEGELEYLAFSYLDTLSVENTAVREKSFHAAISGDTDALPQTEGFQRGAFPGEGYFKMPLEPSCPYPDARLRLETFWRKRPEELAAWTITGSAMRFALKLEKTVRKIAPNHLCVFSGNYENPAAAFDAGVAGEEAL